jgi:hypothetical protein
MGVDVFVETAEAPEKIGPRIEAAVEGLPLQLTQISNRGAKVYPNDLQIEADPVDCVRLRFKVVTQGGTLKDTTILELLTRLEGLAAWVHIEKLSKMDGKPSFTKDQGED